LGIKNKNKNKNNMCVCVCVCPAALFHDIKNITSCSLHVVCMGIPSSLQSLHQFCEVSEVSSVHHHENPHHSWKTNNSKQDEMTEGLRLPVQETFGWGFSFE
jgi:hypothetical protein